MGGKDINAHGSYAGQGIHSGYSVDHTAATLAVSTTETKLTPLTSAKTAITNAISAAEGALPPELSAAVARLKTLREDHVTDMGTIHTFAKGCVSAATSCLAAYENASAEQVAETARAERNIVFENSGLFTNTTAGVNRGLNGTMPSRDEGRGSSWSHGYTSTSNDGGTGTETTTSRTRTGSGSTTVATDTYSYQRQGDLTTSEQTYTAAHTRNGVTDTTTYYSGTAHRGVNGGEESHASGRSYSVSDGSTTTTTTSGTMRVPVAR